MFRELFDGDGQRALPRFAFHDGTRLCGTRSDFTGQRRLHLAFADQFLDAFDGGLVDVEIDVHRVEGDHRGQLGLVRCHQVAARDERLPQSPRDRRGDLRPTEIEVSGLQVGPSGSQRGGRLRLL